MYHATSKATQPAQQQYLPTTYYLHIPYEVEVLACYLLYSKLKYLAVITRSKCC